MVMNQKLENLTLLSWGHPTLARLADFLREVICFNTQEHNVNKTNINYTSESDPHSYEVTNKARKNSEVPKGFELMTSATPVQCSTN